MCACCSWFITGNFLNLSCTINGLYTKTVDIISLIHPKRNAPRNQFACPCQSQILRELRAFIFDGYVSIGNFGLDEMLFIRRGRRRPRTSLGRLGAVFVVDMTD